MKTLIPSDPREVNKPAAQAAYKIVLAYDGTDFSGWQRQPDARTVQGVLESALLKILRRRISVHGAGRTDAGVHAMGQVASFRARTRLTDRDLFRALNAVLPDDVRLISLERTAPHFHARKSAASKTYQYRIFNAPAINPFVHRYVLHIPYRLNVGAMRKAARMFEREADFTAFSSNRELHPVRNVRHSGLVRRGDELIYTIVSSGFLRYMVRGIVGTLLEVGRGKIVPSEIDDIFNHRERSLAGPTAPAKGLCLIRVDYPPRTSPMTKASSAGLT
jgi:tRNA pseudouridine38-40 synthase